LRSVSEGENNILNDLYRSYNDSLEKIRERMAELTKRMSRLMTSHGREKYEKRLLLLEQEETELIRKIADIRKYLESGDGEDGNAENQ